MALNDHQSTWAASSLPSACSPTTNRAASKKNFRLANTVTLLCRAGLIYNAHEAIVLRSVNRSPNVDFPDITAMYRCIKYSFSRPLTVSTTTLAPKKCPTSAATSACANFHEISGAQRGEQELKIACFVNRMCAEVDTVVARSAEQWLSVHRCFQSFQGSSL